MRAAAGWWPALAAAAALWAAIAIAGSGEPGGFDVREYGAAGDGMALDTTPIQSAIDACAAAGGGRVVLTAGRYLSGSLVVKEGVTLWLDPGATLLGSPRIDDYPTGHLISAGGASRIGLEGRGVIDGQGPAFWDAEDRALPRPVPFIDFRSCREVTVDGGELADPRRALWATDLEDAVIDGFEGAPVGSASDVAAIELVDSRGVTIRNSRATEGTATWLELAGGRTAGIRLIGNDIEGVRTPFALAPGLDPGVLAVGDAQ